VFSLVVPKFIGRIERELTGKTFKTDQGAPDAVSWLSRSMKYDMIRYRSICFFLPLFVKVGSVLSGVRRTTSAGKFVQFDTLLDVMIPQTNS
jgi:hypothetical protein